MSGPITIALIAIVVIGGIYLSLRVQQWLRRGLTCAVPDETVDWLFEATAWLLAHLGGVESLRQSRFVTTDDFAFVDELPETERPAAVYDRLLEQIGIDDWPSRLEVGADEARDEETGKLTMGTFGADIREGVGVITYHPSAAERTEHLVPILAHELSHLVLLAIADDPPGGDEMEEPLTDLCSVLLGYGVVATNAALEATVAEDVAAHQIVLDPSLIQFQRLAYLDQQTFAYALAIVATLCDRRDEVRESLELPARFGLHLAEKHIDAHRRDDIAALETVESEDVREADHPLVAVREYLAVQDRIDSLQESMKELRGLQRDRQPRRKRRRRRPSDERSPDSD